MTAHLPQGIAEVDMGDGQRGVDLNRLSVGIERIVVPADGAQRIAEIVEGLSRSRVDGDRRLELFDRFGMTVQGLKRVAEVQPTFEEIR